MTDAYSEVACLERHKALERELGAMAHDVELNRTSVEKIGARMGNLETQIGIIASKLDAIREDVKRNNGGGWKDLTFKLGALLLGAFYLLMQVAKGG